MLRFSVCSDVGNKTAKLFQLVFQVTPELRELYLQYGEDLPKWNGDDTWEIPMPATYVIDQKGTIVYGFVNDDPVKRADPDDVIDAIPSPKRRSFIQRIFYAKNSLSKSNVK
jgi:peroxiredoxin